MEFGRRSLRISLSRSGAMVSPKHLLAVRHQRGRQLAAVEVLRDQRVVGRLEAVLHGQVQRGRRLAAAAHAHQDDVGLLQVAVRLAVVVRQAEVDRLDAVVVLLALARRRRSGRRGGWTSCPSSTSSGSTKVPNMSSTMALQPSSMTRSTSTLTRVVKTIGRRPSTSAVWLISRTTWCALSTVSMNGRRTWRGRIELGQDGVAEGLGGDAGAVGDEEDGMGRVHGRPTIRAAHYGRIPVPMTRRRPFQQHQSRIGGPSRHAPARRPGFQLPEFSHVCIRFSATALVVPFENLRMTDVEAVGGKNASLGEMISQLPHGVRVPRAASPPPRMPSASSSSTAAWTERIRERLAKLDTEDVRALAEAGAEIRGWIEAQPFPPDLEREIRAEFEQLSAGSRDASFAVRSSATAEDLPDASLRRPAGDLPQRRRHRRRAAQDEGGVRLALQRPRDQLPRAQGLRPRATWRCRPACSAWCAPTSAPPA